MRKPTTIFVLATIFLVPTPTAFSANSSTPRLNLITPRGVQRGTENTLRFSGARLSNTQQIFLYDSGIEIVDVSQVDANNVDVAISVAADCRLGEHIAQVRTDRGISDFRSFFVGAMPEIVEVEPNNSIEKPQPVEPNHTINGTITNEDVDVYKVSCKQGEQLNIEIEAMRLGALFDPFVAVLDSDNFEIAISDDSQLLRQDSLISITVPEDGDYFVLVREASYGGNSNCRYRLHLGDFPRPSIAFPAGGQPGSEMEVRFIGDSSGDLVRTITVPQAYGFRSGLFVERDSTQSPSAVTFRISELKNEFETEPNDNRNKIETVLEVPAAFNGIISREGDHDYFKFAATKGQTFDINCYARRLRSGLDAVINIFSASGKHIIGDDDARRPDCYMRFTAPEDGQYLLRVRDHLRRGQPDFVYRVEVASVVPRFSIEIPRVDRYSQRRQQICVPRGNRFATLIRANRENWSGPVELIDTDWPEGITIESKPMVPNLNLMPVVFTATEDAPLSGKLVELKAKHPDDEKSIVGNFRNIADFALGPPNNARFYSTTVDKLACAVTEHLPFKIDMVEPKAPLVRGGSIRLKIVAKRDEGFDAPITIQFPFRPPGVGTRPQVRIKKGETEAYYPLNANGNAQIGSWPVYVIGQSDVQGPAWASTQLAELKVSEPFVTAEMNRTAIHQGETSTIFCKLNHHQAFEGEGTAELLGVPPNIEIPKLTFTKETPELKFQVSTNEKSPIGKHRGLFCRIKIFESGEPVVSTAARSELQINKPKPAPEKIAQNKPAETAAKQQPAKTEAKPKSRLQQLRDAKAKKQDG